MIVADLPDGDLHLVCQVAHAQVSGAIARAWKQTAFVSDALWQEFVEATDHHDDGWVAADALPAVDEQGRPRTFKTLSHARHVEIWQQTLNLARDRSPFQLLLTAAHARWLYTHIPSADDDAQQIATAFVSELDQTMGGLLQTLGNDPVYAAVVEASTLDLLRKLFSFFDALSLVFVRGIDWISFTDELPVGDDVVKMKIHSEMCSMRWGRMTPWPFVEDDVTFSLPMQRIQGRAYRDAEDLRDVLAATKPVMRSFTLGRI